MLKIYSNEKAAAEERISQHWLEVIAQQAEAAKLRDEVARLSDEVAEFDREQILLYPFRRRRKKSPSRQPLAWAIRDLKGAETILPDPVIQSLPEEESLALRFIGCLYLPQPLCLLFELGFIAQSCLE